MNENTFNFLIADDHPLILNGIKNLVSALTYNKTISLANNGKEALEIFEKEPIDILITDISMPEIDGIELSTEVKKKWEDTKIIAFTQYTDIQIIKQLFQINVDAIILKVENHSEIEVAIDSVINGKKYYSKEIDNIILNSIKNTEQSSAKLIIKLSKREKQVLEMIADEKTTKEIADILFLSTPTIETYRRNLFIKFEVKNTAGLIRKAIQLGFIS